MLRKVSDKPRSSVSSPRTSVSTSLTGSASTAAKQSEHRTKARSHVIAVQVDADLLIIKDGQKGPVAASRIPVTRSMVAWQKSCVGSKVVISDKLSLSTRGLSRYQLQLSDLLNVSGSHALLWEMHVKSFLQKAISPGDRQPADIANTKSDKTCDALVLVYSGPSNTGKTHGMTDLFCQHIAPYLDSLKHCFESMQFRCLEVAGTIEGPLASGDDDNDRPAGGVRTREWVKDLGQMYKETYLVKDDSDTVGVDGSNVDMPDSDDVFGPCNHVSAADRVRLISTTTPPFTPPNQILYRDRNSTSQDTRSTYGNKTDPIRPRYLDNPNKSIEPGAMELAAGADGCWVEGGACDLASGFVDMQRMREGVVSGSVQSSSTLLLFEIRYIHPSGPGNKAFRLMMIDSPGARISVPTGNGKPASAAQQVPETGRADQTVDGRAQWAKASISTLLQTIIPLALDPATRPDAFFAKCRGSLTSLLTHNTLASSPTVLNLVHMSSSRDPTMVAAAAASLKAAGAADLGVSKLATAPTGDKIPAVAGVSSSITNKQSRPNANMVKTTDGNGVAGQRRASSAGLARPTAPRSSLLQRSTSQSHTTRSHPTDNIRVPGERRASSAGLSRPSALQASHMQRSTSATDIRPASAQGQRPHSVATGYVEMNPFDPRVQHRSRDDLVTDNKELQQRLNTQAHRLVVVERQNEDLKDQLLAAQASLVEVAQQLTERDADLEQHKADASRREAELLKNEEQLAAIGAGQANGQHGGIVAKGDVTTKEPDYEIGEASFRPRIEDWSDLVGQRGGKQRALGPVF